MGNRNMHLVLCEKDFLKFERARVESEKDFLKFEGARVESEATQFSAALARQMAHFSTVAYSSALSNDKEMIKMRESDDIHGTFLFNG